MAEGVVRHRAHLPAHALGGRQKGVKLRWSARALGEQNHPVLRHGEMRRIVRREPGEDVHQRPEHAAMRDDEGRPFERREPAFDPVGEHGVALAIRGT